MRLTYFQSNADYVYPHQIVMWGYAHTIIREMKDWIIENKINASYVPNRWYFKSQESATLFLLRWG